MQCFMKQPKRSKSQEILLVEESRKVAALNGQRLGLQDDHDLKFLLRGSHLLKVKSTSWRRERFYKLQEDCKTIWQESKKMLRSPESQLFSIEEIQDIRSGHKTEGMEKYAKDVPEVRCFSIIFKDQKKNLDLIAGSERDANHWVSGLGKIIAKSNSMSQRQKLQHWIHACLRKADKNKDNKMSFKELKSFMKEVNIQMDDSYARQIFEQCDKSQTNTLEDDEIEVFYKILTERQEIDSIFSDQAEEKSVMSLDQLVRFLQEEQREEDAGPELALSLIEQYEPNETVKRQKAMSKDGFQMYLLSVDGNIFNKTHGQVYQDMTQPLSHYYISSSHNTYLMEDQLTGPSSTEAYIRALMKGCRCVELDCWDGPNSEPVIYHGYTFTSKILFSDAIKAIKNYAFKVSPYPVIISLENHCSLDQQEIMARHLHSILQDMLLVAPIDSKATILPSPEQLKGKILVKGKKLTPETEEVSDEDEAAEMEDETVKSEVEKKKLSDKLKLAKELSDTVIYCKSVQFQGFADPQPHDEMSSFSEGRLLKLAQESGIDLIHHNVHHLSRIYPAGWRTDSSNYNPVEMWNMGCQIGNYVEGTSKPFGLLNYWTGSRSRQSFRKADSQLQLIEAKRTFTKGVDCRKVRQDMKFPFTSTKSQTHHSPSHPNVWSVATQSRVAEMLFKTLGCLGCWNFTPRASRLEDARCNWYKQIWSSSHVSSPSPFPTIRYTGVDCPKCLPPSPLMAVDEMR